MINLSLTEKEKENLSKDEQEIAMARKLEILILPYLKRNINFFYGAANFPKKVNAYRENMNKEEFEKSFNKRDEKFSIPTVCKPLCDMVVEILRENNLNAETISCDTDMCKHTDVVITTKSGKKYIINYLEDMENVQTGMQTPDFAGKSYYERRYKKFEGTTTTNGVSLKGIDFVQPEQLEKIDKNLGYKKQNMYMNTVINQIKEEFKDFRTIMAENKWINREMQLEKLQSTEEEMKEEKGNIYNKYQNMSDNDILEEKLDWIFNYFNDRMDIKGYTDFTMYYSRLLLNKVLSGEEYKKITRYEGTLSRENIPKSINGIKNVLDLENPENKKKIRFCIVSANKKGYLFSTKANEYLKLNNEQMTELQKYAKISEIGKPSDLMIKLCDKGNALPLVFHPLGGKMLNNREELISKNLTPQEREQAINELVKSIETMDEPVTSITLPYPNGDSKYIYINENDEFAVREGNKEKIYHYDEEKDDFIIETLDYNGEMEK